MRSLLPLSSTLSLSFLTLLASAAATSSTTDVYFIGAYADYDRSTLQPSGVVGALSVAGSDPSILFPYGPTDPPNDHAPCYKFNEAGDKAKMIVHLAGKAPCDFGEQLLFYKTDDCSDGMVMAGIAQVDGGQSGKLDALLPAGEGVASFHVTGCPTGHPPRERRRSSRSRD